MRRNTHISAKEAKEQIIYFIYKLRGDTINTCIVVLGRNRSGTSLVAGILYHLGVWLGENLTPPNQYNPTGFFENTDFIQIHNKILNNWFNKVQLSEDSRWETDPIINFNQQEYANILKKYNQFPLWGIKDPRMCFIFPFFLKTIDKTKVKVKVISIKRDILSSARSISAWDQFSVPFKKIINFCKRLELAKIKSLKKFKGPIIEITYDDIINNPAKNIDKISQFIQKKTGKEIALQLINKKFRHHISCKYFL